MRIQKECHQPGGKGVRTRKGCNPKPRSLGLVLVGVLLFAALIPSGAAFGQSEPGAGQPDPPSGRCSDDPAIISCEPDASSEADLAELRRLVREQFAPFAGEGFGPDDVEIKFIGKGRTADFTETEAAVEGAPSAGRRGGRAEAVDAWRLFNPATQNEFELAAPPSIRAAFDDLIMRSDPKPRTGRGPSPEGGNAPAPAAQPSSTSNALQPGPAPVRTASWSGGDDDRVRMSSPADSYPWSTIADMGGCTATFIGPRHIVTAGHCIYFRGRAATATTPAAPPAWTPNFGVAPGRDANNIPFSTAMPPGPGQSGWYFTPVGWRDPNPAGGPEQFDFAVVVVPDRLGDQVSWMGYGALPAQDFQNGSPLLLRGYPWCEAETVNPERIDEPAAPCTTNGFYAGSACSVGGFSMPDPNGWNRRLTHGCDAGAANSGSAMYTYLEDTPVVVGIHTKSLKCRFVGDSPCTASDTHPLEMTRITPEYRGWISYFRKMFP